MKESRSFPVTGLVSIVIPTYNRPESLRKTLEGIFRQSYKNYEIIVVNDGSELELSKAVEGYPIRKIIRQEHAGAAVARNNAFAKSRGEFLLFCDDDVQLDPFFLEKMVLTLKENPQKDFVYCGFELDGQVVGMQPFDPAKMREGNYINTASLVRRSRFPRFDPRIKRVQGWDLWLTMLDNGGQGALVPEILFKRTSENKPSISDDSNPEGWTYAHAYDFVRRKHRLLAPSQALEVLSRTYISRRDLQLTYPEAEFGDYRRLWAWASDVSAETIPDPACRDMHRHRRF